MDQAEVRKRVESFPRWHYQFDLDGVKTPVWNRGHINRHKQRRAYFFDPLVRLCGGSLAGKRVLDLGCNAGFWSLAAIEAGAEYVRGVDGRQMHVDQAEFVFEVKGVERDRYRFEQADVFSYDPGEKFDVVMCLGLLYHVSKPFELFQRISEWNTDLLVVDTAIDPGRGPYFRIAGQNLDEPRSAFDRPVALHPTSQAVERLALESGYQEVAMLAPRFTDWRGSGSYEGRRRRAFIASKETPLVGLDTEPTKVQRNTLSRAARRARRVIRRTRRRLSASRH
jgi:tRNA (mo5U34)-methyltransferase